MSEVIIVGDSWSSLQPNKRVWAEQVAASLHGITVTNLAFGGTGWHHWSPSGWNYTNQLLPKLRASLVCITCGVNDLSNWSEPWVCATQMADFVSRLKLKYCTPVMVSSYGAPPINGDDTDWIEYNSHLRLIPDAILGFNGEALLTTPLDYDGLHPSQLGHDKIAWAMTQLIKEAI